MAGRKNYTVSANGLSLRLRREPSTDAEILALLPDGSKVKIDPTAEVPDGWKAVESGGFVMAEFLK